MRNGKWISAAFAVLTIASLASTVYAASAGTTWRWMENGKWAYSDRYPSQAKNPERFDGPAELATPKSLGFKSEEARKLFPVVVYGIDCPACDLGKKLLEARKIPATFKDPKLPELYDEFKKFSPNSQAPVMLVGDKPIVGYEPSLWNKALDDAGYEKAEAAIPKDGDQKDLKAPAK